MKKDLTSSTQTAGTQAPGAADRNHKITLPVPEYLYRKIEAACVRRGPECTPDVICRIALYDLFGEFQREAAQ